jgi:GNAT superfamily N-acetyltransferase
MLRFPTEVRIDAMAIRPCRGDERERILAIVNAAAVAYRGLIPADQWHEPYMDRRELDDEIDAGVRFWCYEEDGVLIGVMGIQSVRDVDLIRHAHVVPGSQRLGVGGALLAHLRELSDRRMLVGTWSAAEWAIRFYVRNGFELVPAEERTALLQRYWTIPGRQIEASVVLTAPPLSSRGPHPTAAARVRDSCRTPPPAERDIEFRNHP